MIELLSRHSRDVFNLVHTGQVQRLRGLLASEPALAKEVRNGWTALMVLPDDEARAVEIAELLLAHGADPAVRNEEGLSAAEYADKRALTEAARLLR